MDSVSENEDLSAPSNPASIASTRQPPPESRESIRVRQFVILSFWVVVIFLGLPIWLWTTSIHRARLPLQDMLGWAEGRVFLNSLSLL